MKRRLAAAILTATVTAGAVTLPAAAEWDRGEQDTACVQTVGTPQGTGWQQIGGRWYLITKEGSFYQGWHREKGQWYFLNNSGAMVTGWVEIDGRVYCFGADGVMMTGTNAAIQPRKLKRLSSALYAPIQDRRVLRPIAISVTMSVKPNVTTSTR